MKKILLVSDGQRFSNACFEFAHQLHKIKPFLLTGVFLREIDYLTPNPSHEINNLNEPWHGAQVEASNRAALENNITRFKMLCVSNNIEYSVHKDAENFAISELVNETRFADLAILSNELFYQHTAPLQPNEYLKKILHNTKCPVLAVPEKFSFPRKIILAYDGSDASIYAIKQFYYIFPELIDRNTTLLYVCEESGQSFPEEKKIEELIATHFTKIKLFKLDLNDHPFKTWINNKKDSLLVTGAFGDSQNSRFFHKSFANDLLKDHKIPVFISHR